MEKSKAELERTVRELRVRATTDSSALAELCEVYWMLNRQESAVEAFTQLLSHAGQPQDTAFDTIYRDALLVTRSCPVPLRRRYRLMRLVELLETTAGIEGLVVECGCYLGLSSYMLCSYLRRQSPAFDGSGYHIFDSFAGLSEPTQDDEIPDDWGNADELRRMTKSGHFAAPLEAVKQSLAAFPRITYHAGWIPLTFAAMPESRCRFVHVDVDLYDPTMDAFSYFFPRLSPGGVIVSDDYSWPGARTAINEFCGEHRATLQLSSVGQAIVRKASS